VPLKVVSERLGHSGITITADTYQHVTEGMDRDAADRVAALVFDKSP
jgi:integrase